jgi:hypothetical protein
VLQGQVDQMLRLQQARALMYGSQMGESRRRQVANAAEEREARADGFSTVELADAPANAYPKIMEHPGFPNGGATGMLVKDYRGKNAEQEIWKFDGAPVSQICNALKQAAIEEGQWTETREAPGTLSIEFIRAKLNEGRQRVADKWKQHPDELVDKTNIQ